MRLILIFLITSFVSVGVNSYSQTARLSVNMESATIEEIFDAIEKQSEYIFFYQDQNIDLNRVVSIEVEHKTINEVLDELFKDTGNTYQIKDRQVLIGFDNSKVKSKNEQKEPNNESLQPQKKTITGKVTDANGEPLPGASIIVKGTTIGVTGDVDGNYTLEIPNDAEVLVFSFVGMKVQEIAIGEQTQINISLEEETFGLEEVVAVGYGVQKKTNLTGAVSQIEADKISARPSASITQSLQGALPGLNIKNTTGDPRSTPEINIRGFNSINGGSPLVLIDGIEGNLNLINPTDIESVSVLKDAASAAIYGARGAFGVILVTTKKGVEGEPVITYNNNFSFTTPTARTDFITNPYDYGKIVDAAIYGYNGSSFTGYNDADWERIKRVADGEVAPYNELQANGTFKFFNKTNWYDYLFRKYQSSQNHNISVSGGTKKLKAYLSGRVYKSNTIQKIVDEDYKKYNLKSNIAYQVNDWLEISDNIQYSVGDTKEFGGNRNGWGDTWTYTKNYLYAFMPTQIDGVPYDMYGESDHASLEAGNSWVRNYYKQFINTFRAKLTPIKGLEINFDYSNRINHSGVSTRLNEFQYLTTDHITLSNVGINRLTETRTETNYDALNLFGTYSRTFATKHNLKLMVGFNQESSDQDVILAEQGGLSNPEYANLNLGTEVLRADGSAQLWAVQGYFGRFNYDFENRYLLEFNARYDGSSRFPSESRWGFFPSVSTGWI
ncbi:SusC/RagA family TonB-linked outer membrane protein [uncultured Draconibacterium sp.]|uniref:SusC/RagA family TonB-linked outer membrane protein n=1 Tax=uncultured Draconibacterium sp. TaxID=1573823 RepID=UPI0029C7D643|nr:SusC/RagA family TonB-linked outer membrane protein [uncultured Draconibacterium sp.]